ncbi:sarcosine oxidase subunit gamma [Pseudooceanicola sp. HF7]|uniref:sarcosine oxidase subunit gamma n=1 Tax=Pseudooceanicola sp. HF7 TaxID=2721560 RepID=UPI00142F5836|nr:sarcosine oxidase subunit gamma [Pseudooceanicola sp. HF7]
MAETFTLTAQNALPQGDVMTLGETGIRVAPMARLTTLMPGRGDQDIFARALRRHHGLGLPQAGQSTTADGVECLWFGQGQYLLIGAEANVNLLKSAALTDQSDAWSTVLIEGPLARDVLARLTPLDLRAATFAEGATARTEIRHMMASITRVSDSGFRLMVFRSMAQTLLHELKETLEMVAARP